MKAGPSPYPLQLQDRVAALPVTNPDCVFDLVEEDFAIADNARSRGFGDRVDHILDPLIRNNGLDT